MNCLKNPRRRPKLINAVECYERACNINIVLIANFLEALHELYPKDFGRTGKGRFLDNFVQSVRYLEADNDSEVREYRMAQMLAELPYITKGIAADILKTVALQATAKDRVVLESPEFCAGLVENIVLLLATLHEDCGFGEQRIGRVIERWKLGKITNAEQYMREHLDYSSDPARERRDMEDKLLDRSSRKVRSTAREQIDARRELEALKAYQNEVIKNG